MKIALLHNLPDGGAKRALFEHARHLRARGHVLDAFLPETANEQFLPLAPLCQSVRTYPMPPLPDSIPGGLPERVMWHPAMRPAWRTIGETRRDAWARNRQAQRQVQFLHSIDTVYARIARDINGGGYDFAYIHHCRFLLSPSLLRVLRTPSVYYCQDMPRHIHEWAPETTPDYDTSPAPPGYVQMRGRLYSTGEWQQINTEEQRNALHVRAANLVLANSVFSQENITRACGVTARLCYLGVDAQFFYPTNATRTREVLTVGALTPMKRHDFIVEAIAIIPAARRPALRIVGFSPTHFSSGGLGPFATSLLERAKAAGVTVHIDEGATDESLRDAYRHAGVVAFAPRLEPFGFIPLEAMACEAPVVAVREGGPRESIKEGVTGFLTERDRAVFGQALDHVLCNPTLAEQLGKAGRETVLGHWTWEASTDRLESLVNEFLAQRRVA